jgi:hypothetical protein
MICKESTWHQKKGRPRHGQRERSTREPTRRRVSSPRRFRGVGRPTPAVTDAPVGQNARVVPASKGKNAGPITQMVRLLPSALRLRIARPKRVTSRDAAPRASADPSYRTDSNNYDLRINQAVYHEWRKAQAMSMPQIPKCRSRLTLALLETQIYEDNF